MFIDGNRCGGRERVNPAPNEENKFPFIFIYASSKDIGLSIDIVTILETDSVEWVPRNEELYVEQ